MMSFERRKPSSSSSRPKIRATSLRKRTGKYLTAGNNKGSPFFMESLSFQGNANVIYLFIYKQCLHLQTDNGVI
jgi:hypothetical protein